MKLRNILALLLICMLALNPALTFAEESGNGTTEYLTYQGGVVERGSGISFFSVDPLLEFGYTLANSPYIVLNRPSMWNVVITGGTAPYTCVAKLAFKDSSQDPSFGQWPVVASLSIEDDTFSYTFTEGGYFFWHFEIADAMGQTLTFQTRIYETYSEADESDDTTVAGKVNSIIASEITAGMSDYRRALVLHDWLINHADYDHSDDPYFDAAGVLLHERGVCDSYARAYMMLMTAAGVDCIIVTGTAGGGDHAWNLVKLGGSWYHVDCTWDDPTDANGKGGNERHTYFCVDDETMALDHSWNTPENIIDLGMTVPSADGGEYEGVVSTTTDYDFEFSTIDELDAAFDAEVAAGNYRANTYGMYTGSDDIANSVWPAFQTWLSAKAQELANQGLVSACTMGCSGNMFSISFTWTDPADYMRIGEESLFLYAGETYTVAPSEISPAADAFTWTSSDPSVATVVSSYTEADGLTAAITAHKQGSAVITVTSADNISDSIAVTVTGAYVPEFNLTMAESGDNVSLSWNLVPGATEYRIVHAADGSETTISTVTSGACTLSGSALPVNTLNELYIQAVRMVGETEAAAYSSDKLTYVSLSFAASLPENIVTIASEAFAGDSALNSLYIPDGAAVIESGAFSNTGIEAIRIPASVTVINDSAFSGSDIGFVQTEKGSKADEWFKKNMSEVYIKYE